MDPHWNPCGSITLLKYNGKISFHYSQPNLIREFMMGSLDKRSYHVHNCTFIRVCTYSLHPYHKNNSVEQTSFADPDPQGSASFWEAGSRSESASELSKAGSEFVEAQNKAMEYAPRTLPMEKWRLKMEPWRVCMPVVADSHHSDEEQELNQDPHQVKSRIRIHIKVKPLVLY